MRKILLLLFVLGLFSGLVFSGCAQQQKAESSKEAIEIAKTMETVEQKADYLINQARAFYNSKEFQEAVNAAQYVLRYLDKDSQAAKDLLGKAKEALSSAAKAAADDVKKKLPGFGQ